MYNGVSFTIVVPVGIYTAFSYRDYLNQRFLELEYTMQCVYNYKTYKMSFASIHPIYIINTETYPTTAGNLIGVPKDSSNQPVYPTSLVTPVYTISLGTVDFRSTSYIFIRFDEIQTTNLNSYGTSNNIFARVPVNTPHGTTIFYRPSESVTLLLGAIRLDKLTVSLEDEYNHPLSHTSEFQLNMKMDYILPQDAPEDVLVKGTIPYFFKTMMDKTEDQTEPEPFGVNT